jgi:hypothetical protein
MVQTSRTLLQLSLLPLHSCWQGNEHTSQIHHLSILCFSLCVFYVLCTLISLYEWRVSFFLFFFFHARVFLPMSIYVFHMHAWCLWEWEKGIRSFGTRITDACELCMLGTKMSSLQEQQGFSLLRYHIKPLNWKNS